MRNLIIVTGPSCSGKTTLVGKLQGITRVVSTTTRPIREGEVNGVDYHFVTAEEFEKLKFIERSEVYGNQYGVTVDALEQAEGNVVIILDVQGALEFQDLYGTDATFVFLHVPIEELSRRMEKRGDINNKLRLERAYEEMQYECCFNHVLSGENTLESLTEIIKGGQHVQCISHG